MSNPNFIDYVKICCRSGKGGAGSAHLFRDKLNAKGGPDGGDGGPGGSVVLRGNAQMWTLLHLKYRKHVICENGQNGGAGRKTGRSGKNEVIDVPLGTVAKDAESGEILFEITEDGQEEVLLAGGRGGLGNWHFKSSTFQTPRFAQPGEDGKEEWKILELKVLADVGLVGFPNAGKSTLLSVITAAKPEIADYPFTTLVPNLGIVPYRDYQSFVIADIPGIIEGASEGKGIGHRFLRHIERNSVLLIMIPMDSKDILADYKVLQDEMRKFSKALLYKKQLLAITKSDMADNELIELTKAQLPTGIPYVFISAVTGLGIQELKDTLWQMLNS